MLFERFEVKGLAHYSYAIGCAEAGALVIVDPERNVDRYLDFAERHKLRITHVLETHIHADYASGARALGGRSGAEVRVSGYDKGEPDEVAFPHHDLFDGDAIEVGSVRIEALHTPGHTPEHLAYLVYDGSRRDDVPEILLSGDFLFVGSLGRPDLLGEEAKMELARKLFASVRDRLADLPDGLEVHPAHGAGSLCGAGMSGRASSTLGYERQANPYLDPTLGEARFVEMILGTVPPFPPYYLRMKKLNAEGAPSLDAAHLEKVPPAEFAVLLETGHVAIDLRDHLAWCGGHIPDSFWIGAGPSVPVWASWVVPYETPILLVADDEHQAREAAHGLARVGLDDVRGWLAGGIVEWRTMGLPVRQTAVMSARDVHERLEAGRAAPNVLDVRADHEWEAGHIEGAVHVFAGQLPQRLDEVPAGPAPLAIICGSGYRSTVACSVLERAGVENCATVTGGMQAWRSAGLPTSRAAMEVTR